MKRLRVYDDPDLAVGCGGTLAVLVLACFLLLVRLLVIVGVVAAAVYLVLKLLGVEV